MNKKIFLTIDKEYVESYGLESSYIGKSIILYEERIPHIEKHKEDFSSVSSYNYSFNGIKGIVSKPDFIVEDTNNNSILFIRQLTDCTLVAVGKSTSKELKIKTMYPISEKKKERLLNNNINKE